MDQRGDVVWYQRLYTGVGVEIAVGTLGLAEGDVDVEGQRAVRGVVVASVRPSGCGRSYTLKSTLMTSPSPTV